MRLYNSAWIDVFAGLVLKGAGLRRIRLTVRYGIIDLRERGLGLVDTGMGADVTRGPRSAALRLYSAVLRPQLIESQSPEAVLRNLGVTPVDIRLVVLTHFHADHVSSLRAFPNAQIITSAAAARNVMQMSAAAALHHGIFKELIPPDIERRLLPLEDLKRVPTGTVLGDGHDLFGDGSYLAVPLPGHAFGHFGIFWRDDPGPVLYATDATWTTVALMQDRTPFLSSAIVFDDRRAGRRTESILREFARQGGRIPSLPRYRRARIMTRLATLAWAYLRTRLLHRWLNSRERIARWQRWRLASFRRDAVEHIAFYRAFGDAPFSTYPIVDKQTVMGRFEDFNRLGLTAAQMWAMIDHGEAPAGHDAGCSTGTSGNRGLYLISDRERFVWLGTIVAKALPLSLRRPHVSRSCCRARRGSTRPPTSRN